MSLKNFFSFVKTCQRFLVLIQCWQELWQRNIPINELWLCAYACLKLLSSLVEEPILNAKIGKVEEEVMCPCLIHWTWQNCNCRLHLQHSILFQAVNFPEKPCHFVGYAPIAIWWECLCTLEIDVGLLFVWMTIRTIIFYHLLVKREENLWCLYWVLTGIWECACKISHEVVCQAIGDLLLELI